MSGTASNSAPGKTGTDAERSTDKKGPYRSAEARPDDPAWWAELDARMAALGIAPPPDDLDEPDDDAPPEPRDRAIIDSIWFPQSPTLAAVAEGPLQPPSWWDEAPTEPDPFLAQLDRLNDDLDAHPDCSTIEHMATRDRATGKVVGVGYSFSPLEHAYTSGAPAELIVEAERVTAFIGERGTRGYRHRAIRMAHQVRKLNRQLARYNGLNRTLGTVTVLWPLSSPLRRVAAARLALAAAAGATHRATTSKAGPNAPPGSGHDPPPLDSATVAPLLRTGPPALRVRVAA